MLLNNFARACKRDVTNTLSGKREMGCSKSRDKPGKGSLAEQGQQSHRIKQGQAGRGTASTGSRQSKVQGVIQGSQSEAPEGRERDRTGVQARTQIKPPSQRQNQIWNWRQTTYNTAPRSIQEKEPVSQDSRRHSWVQVYLWHSTGKGPGPRGRLCRGSGWEEAPGKSCQGN